MSVVAGAIAVLGGLLPAIVLALLGLLGWRRRGKPPVVVAPPAAQ